MMMSPFPTRLQVTLFTLTPTLLSGYVLIQDEPSQVAIVNPQQARLAQVVHLADSNWPAARWRGAYGDSQLNMLINRMLQNSSTTRTTRLRISQSWSTVELARSAMGLQATTVTAQNRLRITGKSFSWSYSHSLPVGKNGPWYTLGTIGVGTQLSIDLWGTDRTRIAAVIGEKNARLVEIADIELNVASSVAQLYFTTQAAFQKITLLQELGDIAQFSVAIHENRTQRDMGDNANAINAQAEQLAARQQIVSARGMLTQYRKTLRALIGADA